MSSGISLVGKAFSRGSCGSGAATLCGGAGLELLVTGNSDSPDSLREGIVIRERCR